SPYLHRWQSKFDGCFLAESYAVQYQLDIDVLVSATFLP
ncbi:MAG: hypothetical protein ACI82Z_001153, partial [Cellvibrionaceae bacterium]